MIPRSSSQHCQPDSPNRLREAARARIAVRFDETTLFVGEIPNNCHYTDANI